MSFDFNTTNGFVPQFNLGNGNGNSQPNIDPEAMMQQLIEQGYSQKDAMAQLEKTYGKPDKQGPKSQNATQPKGFSQNESLFPKNYLQQRTQKTDKQNNPNSFSSNNPYGLTDEENQLHLAGVPIDVMAEGEEAINKYIEANNLGEFENMSLPEMITTMVGTIVQAITESVQTMIQEYSASAGAAAGEGATGEGSGNYYQQVYEDLKSGKISSKDIKSGKTSVTQEDVMSHIENMKGLLSGILGAFTGV